MNYYIEVLKKYAVFEGRAQRAEYWYFILFNLIINIAFTILAYFAVLFLYLGQLYSLAVIIPGLAVTWRRLHDTGRSGWWVFINLIPIVGLIIFIVFLATDGTPGQNQYGQNPKEEKEKSMSGKAPEPPKPMP